LKNKNNSNNKIIIIICIVTGLLIIFRIISMLFIFALMFFSLMEPPREINGIDKYDKNYYIEEYGGDLDSNLSIFPDNKKILTNAKFKSSFSSTFFDTEGYIILRSKYDKATFFQEIERLSNLKITINENCKKNSKTYTNKVLYDKYSYYLPAYVTIDGFANTYEYALIDRDNYEITYIYLAYPDKDNIKYKDYLKRDTRIYDSDDTLKYYSMYNHSFDNGFSYSEYSDCN